MTLPLKHLKLREQMYRNRFAEYDSCTADELLETAERFEKMYTEEGPFGHNAEFFLQMRHDFLGAAVCKDEIAKCEKMDFNK